MWTIWHLLLDNLQWDLKVIHKNKGRGKHQAENRDLDRGILSSVTKPQAPSHQTDRFKLPHTTRGEQRATRLRSHSNMSVKLGTVASKVRERKLLIQYMLKMDTEQLLAFQSDGARFFQKSRTRGSLSIDTSGCAK